MKHIDTGLFKVFYNDPIARSLHQLVRRAEHNESKFAYWVSLTFAENKYVKTKKGPEMGAEHHFTRVLKDFLPTMGGHIMRKFLNRFREHFRKRRFDKKAISYLWKYEEGKKTKKEGAPVPHRPHFHALLFLPDLGFELDIDSIKKFIMSKWSYGFVRVKRISESKKLRDYLRKYFTKGNKLRYWKGGKKWGCSRDVVRPPKPEVQWEYQGPLTYEAVLLTVREHKDDYVETYGEKLFRFYTDRLGKKVMQEYRRAVWYRRLQKITIMERASPTAQYNQRKTMDNQMTILGKKAKMYTKVELKRQKMVLYRKIASYT